MVLHLRSVHIILLIAHILWFDSWEIISIVLFLVITHFHLQISWFGFINQVGLYIFCALYREIHMSLSRVILVLRLNLLGKLWYHRSALGSRLLVKMLRLIDISSSSRRLLRFNIHFIVPFRSFNNFLLLLSGCLFFHLNVFLIIIFGDSNFYIILISSGKHHFSS